MQALVEIGGTQGPERFHRRLGDLLYKKCGVTRTAEGLAEGGPVRVVLTLAG